VLFLSARTADEDRIKGLKLGGDDYITKPFSIEELVLKIEIFLKRSKVQSKNEAPAKLELQACKLDISNQSLSINDQTKHLTERETKLLAMFFEQPKQIVKREQILLHIWGDDGYFAGRSLDVFISKIRKYIKEDKSLKIENIHGIGFRLNILE
jgi:DNA-binding response OmpR family regulator